MPVATPPLRIAIVGGGIGGLVAAIGILDAQRKGANVSLAIYESLPSYFELGAGLSFGSNAIRCFKLMGLEQEFDKAAGPEGDDGKMWYSLEVGEDGHEYTGRVFGTVDSTERIEAVHRADFLDSLVGRLPEGISHFNHRIESYETSEEGVTMHFSPTRDGKQLPDATCDVLIGADGIKSRIRQCMLARAGLDPLSAEAVYQNWTVWRGMIPIADFRKACPETSWKTTFFGKGKHIVVFPVRGGELVNLVGYVWDDEAERLVGRAGPWTEHLPIEEAIKDYEGWSEKCHNLLRAIPEPSRWGVFACPPIETPVDISGKVVIVGDAAHATTPHNGAGAGQAVEDGLFISQLLSSSLTTESSNRGQAISAALEVYKDFRHKRGLHNVVSSKKTGRILDMSGLDGEGNDVEKITKSLQRSLDEVWKYDTVGEIERALEVLKTKV